MNHWTEAYLDRQYVEGEYECSHFVMDVVRDTRGLDLVLPTYEKWKGSSPFRLAAMCQDFAEETVEPSDGDAVLMRVVGRKRSLGSHIGVFAACRGKPWVLHMLENAGAMFVPVRNLKQMHLEPVGYYRWLSV